MRNIVTYMAEEQRTFAESPFNPVDSLVFATLAYFNYEVAPGVDLASPDGVLLHDVVMLSDWEALTAHSWMEDAKDTEAFLHVLSASRRMRDVRASFYANERSEIVEKQFSAVTLTFPAADGEVAYLAYRGTGGSFAGWKEDFNLCFKEVIPSQCTAAAYLSGVASALACPLIVGGHSKGGNLAEYAALVADESAFERLRGVFNHDGPSFLDDPSPRIDDDRFHAQDRARVVGVRHDPRAPRRLPRGAILGYVGVPARAFHLVDRRRRLRVPGGAQPLRRVFRRGA